MRTIAASVLSFLVPFYLIYVFYKFLQFVFICLSIHIFELHSFQFLLYRNPRDLTHLPRSETVTPHTVPTLVQSHKQDRMIFAENVIIFHFKVTIYILAAKVLKDGIKCAYIDWKIDVSYSEILQ
jgi:hypothetical protein